MTPGELYQAGQLDEAIQVALEGVKKHPQDTDRRGQLCELLCFAGELERADKQLDTIGQQDPRSQLGVSMLRQLIRAETARQQFFLQGRLPEMLDEPTAAMRLQLEASIAIREGHPEEAAAKLKEAEQQRVKVSGLLEGQEFTDFRDLDDLTSSFFEVLTSNGKYYWIPMERVEFLEFRAPERPKDLLWRRCNMVVHEGPEGEVFLPSLYPGTHTSDDRQLKLGRATDWIEPAPGLVRGVGQRTFLIGEQDQPILQLKEVTFRTGKNGES